MAVHVYSEFQIDRMVDSAKRFRARFCIFASTMVAATIIFALARPTFPAFHEPVRGLIGLFVAVFLVPLVTHLRKWSNMPGELSSSLSKVKVDISPSIASVVYGSSGLNGHLSRGELLRAEEPTSGEACISAPLTDTAGS